MMLAGGLALLTVTSAKLTGLALPVIPSWSCRSLSLRGASAACRAPARTRSLISAPMPKRRSTRCAEASEAQIRAAAQAAHATEFLDPLPQGFATFLGEKGVRLAGGQPAHRHCSRHPAQPGDLAARRGDERARCGVRDTRSAGAGRACRQPHHSRQFESARAEAGSWANSPSFSQRETATRTRSGLVAEPAVL